MKDLVEVMGNDLSARIKLGFNITSRSGDDRFQQGDGNYKKETKDKIYSKDPRYVEESR